MGLWGGLLREILAPKQSLLHRSVWLLEAFAGVPGAVDSHREAETRGAPVCGERGWLATALVSNANSADRAAWRELLAHAVRVVARLEGWGSAAIAGIVDAALALVPGLPRHWATFAGVFELLFEMSHEEGGVELLLSKHCVAPLLEIYLYEDSPFFAERGWSGSLGDRMEVPGYIPIIRLVARLLSFSTPSIAEGALCPEQQGSLGDLSPRCKTLLACPLLASRVLEMEAPEDALVAVLVQLSWGELEQSSNVVRRLCDHAVSLDPVPKVADHLMHALLNLNDGLVDERVAALSAQLAVALSENSACEEVCVTVLTLLSAIIDEMPQLSRAFLQCLASVESDENSLAGCGLSATFNHSASEVRYAVANLGEMLVAGCLQDPASEEQDPVLEELMEFLATREPSPSNAPDSQDDMEGWTTKGGEHLFD